MNVILSGKEWERFQEICNNPKPATKYMKELRKKYKDYEWITDDGAIRMIHKDEVHKDMYFDIAEVYASQNSLDPKKPTGAVLVKDQKIIGMGTNGSMWHEMFGCLRKRLKIKTGKHYWLCPGCHPRNHAERKCILSATSGFQLGNVEGATLYLTGHTWACCDCLYACRINDVRKVILRNREYDLT